MLLFPFGLYFNACLGKRQLLIIVIINHSCIHTPYFSLGEQKFIYNAKVKSNPLTLYDAVFPVCTFIRARERKVTFSCLEILHCSTCQRNGVIIGLAWYTFVLRGKLITITYTILPAHISVMTPHKHLILFFLKQWLTSLCFERSTQCTYVTQIIGNTSVRKYMWSTCLASIGPCCKGVPVMQHDTGWI
jgi:hypothetical protein